MEFLKAQMFLVMDSIVLPDHIKKTFRLSPVANGWESDLSGIQVGREGDDIDMRAYGYLLVYAANTWHRDAAANLYNQLKSLRPDAMVMSIPVEVDEQTPLPPFHLNIRP